jgi:hypothetical protein
VLGLNTPMDFNLSGLIVKYIFAIIVVIALFTNTAQSRIWTTYEDGSGDAPSIQACVDLAAWGDTVVVGCGIYYESSIALKSGLVIRSETGFADCVTIDAQQLGHGFWCSNFEDVLIWGFTITNGYANDGGAVWIAGSSVTIKNCVMYGNHAFSFGGAIMAMGETSLALDGCSIYDNDVPAVSNGGAIAYHGGGGHLHAYKTEVSSLNTTDIMLWQTTPATFHCCSYNPSKIVMMGDPSPISVYDGCMGDVESDQGGLLTALWSAFSSDTLDSPDPIVSYDIQRNELGLWETIVTIPAIQDTSYQASIPTPDIFTVNQPEPYSKYRIAASTSDPLVFFYTQVDSAYSMDNIPPPKPEAALYDDEISRMIIWSEPAIPDYDSACIFRGTVEGFDPMAPIACVETPYYLEDYLGYTFYRVQFSDIHGNLSEFSDELHGQYPTRVESLPTAYTLHQCSPNPFNPSTTIKFSLPESSPVNLVIYDVSGRLVRTLIDGHVIDAGEREKQWDGLDDSGRQVSAGVYFAKMNAGEVVDVKRMALVK